MYVYSQGRRLKRRDFGKRAKTAEQAVQVNLLEDEEFESLLGQSLLLWDEAESRLDGLERTWTAAQRDFDLPSPKPPLSAPERSNVTHPNVNSRRLSPLQLDLFGATSSAASSSQLKDLQHELYNLKEQLEQMRKANQKLETQLADSVVEKKRIQRELHQSQEALQSQINVEIFRRFHFIKNSSSLMSTSGPEAMKSIATGGKPEFAYFEVKLPEPQESSEPSDLDNMARYTRFAYSDAPSSNLFASDEKQGNIDPHVIAKWLTEVEPRTYTDAGVLLLLAKDILRRLISEELQFQDSLRAAHEAKIISLQSIVDNADQVQARAIVLMKMEMEKQQREHLKELNEVRSETAKRVQMAKRDAVALKMKNLSMQAKVDKVKDFWRDMQHLPPRDQVDKATKEEKIEMLQYLLEQDRVNFFLPEDFTLNCNISESSMIHWCQQYLRCLESKHAGTGVWLQMVCDVFMTNPPHLAKKVLGWYRNGNPEALANEDRIGLNQNDADSKGKEGPYQALRQDLHTGKQTIWDVASFLLQIPKESAMAELLGFTEDDEEVVMPLWPEFLVWFHQQHAHRQMRVPHPALVEARKTLTSSPQWESLRLKAHIRENDLFDIESIYNERPFSLEETAEVIASIYDHRQRQSQESDPFHASESAFPEFVRSSLLKKHVLRGFAGKNLVRLQRSVRAYHKGNSRTRVFGKLSGMVNPLRFYEGSEAFLLAFWGHLMRADHQAQSRNLGRQHSMWPAKAPRQKQTPAELEREQQRRQWPGPASSFGKEPRGRIPALSAEGLEQRGSEARSQEIAAWSGMGVGWKAERTSLLGSHVEGGVEQGLGRWMHIDRAVQVEDVVEAAGQALREKLLPLPGFRGEWTEAQLTAMVMPALVGCSRGHKLPLKDLEKLATRQAAAAEEEAVQPRESLLRDGSHPDLGRIAEESVDIGGGGRAAGAREGGAAGKEGVEEAKTAGIAESKRAVAPDMSQAAVSLDLVSDILLDAWYKVLRAQEEFLLQTWKETEKIWDWGTENNSPDLDQLRLFIGIKCGLALREDDLVRLYMDISDHQNNIDARECVPMLLRALYRGRPFVPVEKAKRMRSYRVLPLKQQSPAQKNPLVVMSHTSRAAHDGRRGSTFTRRASA